MSRQRRRAVTLRFWGLGALVSCLAVVGIREVHGGLSSQGLSSQGLSSQGLSSQGLSSQGLSSQGLSSQGLSSQGLSSQGLSSQGLSSQGLSSQGLSSQGLSSQGLSSQGLSSQGLSSQGLSSQGLSSQGLSSQGLSSQGLSSQGLSSQGMQLRGIDRVRSLFVPLQTRQIVPVNVGPLPGIQGVQSNTPLTYSTTNTFSGVQLQAGPPQSMSGGATQASGPGNFIYVPTAGPGSPALDLRGTLWNMIVAQSCATDNDCAGVGNTTCVAGGCVQSCTQDSDCTAPATCSNSLCNDTVGAIPLYISDVEVDTRQNSSKYPSNADIYLYTVYYRQPGTGQWSSLCPLDPYGQPVAMAVPVNFGDWSSAPSRGAFSFACTGSGVAAKCARNWGYKPWAANPIEQVWNGSSFVSTSINLAHFYNTCVIAARADYCQDNQSFTENGTTVDLFDSLGDGFTSINYTVGVPFAPNSPGIMLHEEYQISVDSYVQPLASDLASLPANDISAIEQLHKSGLESSRYADLDPGRTCLASNYLDRCAPKEPYDCYREDNMSSQGYGPFIAINSPRHCSHNEANEGEALDPLCNECVNRICQIRPTCCGDPGASYFPGSLVWDDQCVALESQVCKSSPSGPEWDAGTPAVPASSHTYAFPNGATGSFERIVSDGTNNFAEGWACDPDFPTASIPVQLSVNGPLGGSNTTLSTTSADAELLPAWRQAVAMECGELSVAGRHGFRFQLPASSAGQDVYAYGIDLNVPGAPFTLLRGGKKTAPGGATLPPVQAALWTGWIEPATSGSYTFSVNAGQDDSYHVWVNGIYVVGKWAMTDPVLNPSTLVPPYSPPSLYLQQGVRYGVRVEYLRPDPSDSQFPNSAFHLFWSTGSTPVEVPPTSLFPIAEGGGNGLQGTFTSSGGSGSDGAANQGDGGSAPVTGTTFGGVDFTWTHGTPPVSNIDIASPFTGQFLGQVVPPITGVYTFTADADGPTTISVNGQMVTDQSTQPPVPDEGTCEHDICNSGSAVSHTCAQGDFCADRICRNDEYCCSVTWDDRCVEQVASVCQLTCTKTPPIPISLQAGAKYDIEVDYSHLGGAGGSLHLMWALPGAPRAVVPASRLFAADGLSVAQRSLTGLTGSSGPQGLGLNATYFANSDFTGEYLERVEGQLFDASSAAPDSLDTASMMAAGTTATCGAGSDPIGAPAITQPADQSVVSRPSDQPVAISGSGSRGASITIYDNGEPLVTATADPSSGQFSASVQLSSGSHSLSASQSCGGTSDSSANVSVMIEDAPDPAAPAPPTVSQPPNAIVSDVPTVTVSGTATPGATAISVNGGTFQTLTLDPTTGAWSGVVAVSGPGSYQLSFTQTVNGHTSPAGPSVNVSINLPPLTLTSPSGTSVTSPITIAGQAGPSSGDVLVAEEDGTDFLAPEMTIPVNGDGSFSAQLALDYGKHTLKVYQHANGLDGSGVVVTLLVPPPSDGLFIQTPIANAIVPQTLPISGGGALSRTGPNGTGLRGTINIYEGTGPSAVLLGSGPLNDDGSFLLPSVTLQGAGSQFLSVSQTATSLSGGGSAESATTTPIMVFVTPPPPVITSPSSVLTQSALTVSVTGSALPLADVNVYLTPTGATQAGATTQVQADSSGAFSTSLTVAASGTYGLTATQTVDIASSQSTAPLFVALGDTTPPTVCAPPIVSQPATDPSGTVVNFAVIAIDQSPVDCPSLLASGASSPLTPSCVPSSGSPFPLGTTKVTCEAFDQAGNRGATTFDVSVTSSAGPVISTTGLTAEAQGPNGSPVTYGVTALGWVADCAAQSASQISPCASWFPAAVGLGFNPSSVAQDTNPQSPNFGTLYAGSVSRDGADHLFSSADGSHWTELTSPGAGSASAIFVDSGSLYVPSDAGKGVRVSHDGGTTWQSALPGLSVFVTQDPTRPQHMTAWTDVTRSQGALYETFDGWATLNTLTLRGLPSEQIVSLAFDPDHPGNKYVSMAADCPAADGCIQTRIFYGDGVGAWQQLNVPDPLQQVASVVATQPGGIVVAGTAISTDGGQSWSPLTLPTGVASLTSVVFDASGAPIYAASGAGLLVAQPSSGGTIWGIANNAAVANAVSSVISNVTDPTILYGIQVSGLLQYTISSDGQIDWSLMSSSTSVLSDSGVADLSVDPVDPSFAYVLAGGSISKTTDGGSTWGPSNGNLMGRYGTSQQVGLTAETVPLPPVLFTENIAGAQTIVVDHFDRNVVYAGGYGIWKSTDGATSWTNLVDDNFISSLSFPPYAFSVDPYLSGTLYFGTEPDIFDTDFGLINYGVMQGTALSRQQLTVTSPASGPLSGAEFQFGPPPQSTVIMSFNSNGWFTALPNVTTFGVIQPQSGVPTFDNSDGSSSLFASGGDVANDANVLYKTPLANVDWQPLGGGNGLTTDFSRLLIDPATSGQVMYTSGSDGSFWSSTDSGLDWQADTAAPSFVTRTWLSPVDGAVYATVSSSPPNAADQARGAWAGELWKRTVGTGTPPSARLVQSAIRVTCLGTGDSATSPGSVFPLGQTPLHCTATDAFGNVSSQVVTITVQDTTPPEIVFTGPTSAVAPAGATSVMFAPPVAAQDTVDGSITFASVDQQGAPELTCQLVDGTPVPASGVSFPVGSTPVTCTAHDAHQNTTSLTFSVVVTGGGADTSNENLFLSTPADQTLPAVDASGATFSVAPDVYAFVRYFPSYNTANVSVTCVPSLSSTLPLGSTEVLCSATSPDGLLTATSSFRVDVVDQTPPVITPPAQLPVTASATGPFGGIAVFVPTAIDNVDGAVPVTCAPSSGSTFPIGTTEVSCYALDAAGNRATASFDVVVGDGTPPVLTLADTTVEATDDTGAENVSFNPQPTVSDVVGVASFECLPPTGSWFPLGDSTVTCTAVDTSGNEASGSFTVHVVDHKPLVTVPGTITVEAESPEGAPVTFVSSADDIVSGKVMPTCTRGDKLGTTTPVSSGDTFPLGDTTVTCDAVGADGDVGTGSFVVVVRDTTPPTLVFPAPITVVADGTGTAAVTYVATATDLVSGAVPVGCMPPPGNRFGLGVTIVSCVARDGAGNEAKGAFTVTVQAPVPPKLGLPTAVSAEATGPSGATVTYQVTAVDARGNALTPNCSPASGALFALGSTPVTCSATDSLNVSASGSFTVAVVDTTPPKLILPAPITVVGSSSGAVVNYTASATDLVSGPVTPVCTPASGSFFPIGTTPVSCYATDAAGNRSPPGTFSVTVNSPATPPVVKVPANMTVEATSAAGAVVVYVASANDTQDGPLPVSCSTPSGAVFPLGVTLVTCSATDSAKLSGSATFSVTVRDTTPPRLPLPSPIVVDADATGSALVTFSVVATDLVSGTLPALCTPASGTRFSLGTTVVNCTATDSSGNTATGSFTVTVRNLPVVKVPANLVAEATGPNGAAVSFEASATDATGAALTPICSPPSASTFPIGTTTVTCTAIDSVGGQGSASFSVTVRDTTGPVFPKVPGTVTAFATSTSGAVVNYVAPIATDAVDGARPVTCRPASGAQFPIGKSTVSCQASDTRGNQTSVTFAVWVTYQAPTDGTFFLPPIKSDGGSIFKLGSTVPVKFILTGASAKITNLQAHLRVAKISNNVTGTYVEPVSNASCDSGDLFRYDPLTRQYIYNLSTKPLSVGSWSLQADLGDGVSHVIKVSFR
jgi:large repetitive protein